MSVAIVTGSTSGIGLAIATALHKQGHHVVVNGVEDEASGAEIAYGIGDRAHYVAADVSLRGDARRLVAAAVELGPLELLVNNAGIAQQVPHDDLEAADEIWDRILGINLRGPWNMALAARAELRLHRGQIVQIASIAGMHPTGSSIPYAVSKAGCVHLTRLLAKALGPEIRVNAIAPAYIDTPLTHDWNELREHITEHAPLRRLGNPEDVAQAVLALAGLDYVTGAVLPVDGGLLLL